MNTDSSDSNRVIIFDTTLRDGEQAPGASMVLEEKLLVARGLDEMGVDVIEAGFPVASKGDFEAVQEIAKAVRRATVCGLARARKEDIEATAEAIKPAARQRIHTFIATSPLHMEYKLKMQPEEVIDAIKESVSYAKRFTDDVDWSPEDGTRTEHDFLCRAVETAITAGATTINIPDTVGYSTPEEFAALIAMLIERVPNSDKAIFSTHCHNDLGLAVANSLAALGTGARQIECTINGIGERAGNAALEEIVMAIRTRPDLYPYTTGIDTTQISRVSKLVSNVTGFAVQNNKAIVGANAFAHESGIHQHGMLANARTYEIMTPESVGLARSRMAMGKHSGRAAFREKLKELGIVLGDNALAAAFEQFKSLADKKKEVFDEDIIALVDAQSLSQNARIRFLGLRIEAGTEGPQTATMTLEINGEKKSTKADGKGPVDAIFRAIRELYPHKARLKLYQVHAVTGGIDAQAEVSVRLEDSKRLINGHGTDTDTLIASAKAYVNALNNMLYFDARDQEKSEAASESGAI